MNQVPLPFAALPSTAVSLTGLSGQTPPHRALRALLPALLPQQPAESGGRPRPAPASAPARDGGDPADALGFDHARWGLTPPADCLWPGHPVRQGWQRGRDRLAGRTRTATPEVHVWLALRLQAWRAGDSVDQHQLTVGTVRALMQTTHCPVSARRLDAAARLMRVDPARGWTAGNLVRVAADVADIADTLDWAATAAALRDAEDAAQPAGGNRADADRGDDASARRSAALPLPAWRRLLALKSLATPLPADLAATLPLRVLPPQRLRLANPVQALQALLSLQLTHAGWGPRAVRVADLLPTAAQPAFHLFFQSLLARALAHGLAQEATSLPLRRQAIEQAWGDERVLRRWQAFTAALGLSAVPALLQKLLRALDGDRMPGVHLRPLEADLQAAGAVPATAPSSRTDLH